MTEDRTEDRTFVTFRCAVCGGIEDRHLRAGTVTSPPIEWGTFALHAQKRSTGTIIKILIYSCSAKCYQAFMTREGAPPELALLPPGLAPYFSVERLPKELRECAT